MNQDNNTFVAMEPSDIVPNNAVPNNTVAVNPAVASVQPQVAVQPQVVVQPKVEVPEAQPVMAQPSLRPLTTDELYEEINDDFDDGIEEL